MRLKNCEEKMHLYHIKINNKKLLPIMCKDRAKDIINTARNAGYNATLKETKDDIYRLGGKLSK